MSGFYGFLIAFLSAGILSGIIVPIYIAIHPNISNRADNILLPLSIGLVVLTLILLIGCLISGFLVAQW